VRATPGPPEIAASAQETPNERSERREIMKVRTQRKGLAFVISLGALLLGCTQCHSVGEAREAGE
jgi:hypothetical protein